MADVLETIKIDVDVSGVNAATSTLDNLIVKLGYVQASATQATTAVQEVAKSMNTLKGANISLNVDKSGLSTADSRSYVAEQRRLADEAKASAKILALQEQQILESGRQNTVEKRKQLEIAKQTARAQAEIVKAEARVMGERGVQQERLAGQEALRTAREKAKEQANAAREAEREAKAAQKVADQNAKAAASAQARAEKMRQDFGTAELGKQVADGRMSKGTAMSMLYPGFDRNTVPHNDEAIAKAMEYDKTLNKLNKAVDGHISSLSNTRYALYDVGAAYAGVSALASGFVASTVGTAVQFEDSFAQVIRTAELTGDEISNTRDELIRMSQTVPESFANLNETMALGGQLGIPKDDLIDFTEIVTKLTATTDLASEEAGNLLGRFSALYNVAGPQFENLASSVLAVGVNSMATETDIANVSLQLTSMGGLAGLTTDQLVGMSGALASLGMPPELSRSVITQIFTNIDKSVRGNGERLQEWAKLAGVSAEEFKAAWGTENFAPVFQSVLDNLNKAGTQGGAQLEKLGLTAQRITPNFLLMARGTDVFRSSFADAAKGWNEGTQLAEQYGIIAETTSARLRMLGNSFKALFDTLGSTSNSLLGPILQGFKGLVDTFQLIINNPIGRTISTVAIGVTALVGAFAAWNTAKAMIIASEYALQTAMQGNANLSVSMTGTVLRLAKGFKNMSTATNEGTAAISGQTAEFGRHSVAAKASAAAVGSVAGSQGVLTKSLSETSLIVKLTEDNITQTANKTGLLAAGFNKVKGAASSLIGVLKGFGPMLAISGAMTGIGWLVDKFRSGREQVEAEVAGMSASISQAITQDTMNYREGTEGVLMYAKAVSSSGEAYVTAMQAAGDKAAQDDLLAQAQAGLKDKIEDTNASIEAQIFYYGEAARQAAAQELLNNKDASSKFAELKQGWAEVAEYTNLDFSQVMESIAQGGDNATQSLSMLRDAAGTLGNDMGLLHMYARVFALNMSDLDSVEAFHHLSEGAQEALEHISGLGLSADEALDRIYQLANGFDESSIAINDVADNLDFFRDVLGKSMSEAEYVNEMLSLLGLEGIDAGDGMDYAAGGADNLSGSLQMLEVDAYNAMYSLGQSIAQNGADFDYLSANGRANLSVLQQAMSAAAASSGGDANAFVASATDIINGLLSVGVSSANVIQNILPVINQAAKLANIGGIKGAMAPILLNFATVSFKKAEAPVGNFNRVLNDGYNAGMRSAAGSRAAGNGARRAGNDAKKGGKQARDAAKSTQKEVRTLTDYVGDLEKVMKSAFEIRWGYAQAVDSVAESWSKLHDRVSDAKEAIQDAKDDMADAKNAIRDAKQEIQELNADLNKLYAERDIIQFKYRVAVEYGDTLRANDLKADLDKNSSDISAKKNDRADAGVDLNTGNADLAKATKELAQAQDALVPKLSGTSKSARDQREMVWSLIQSYQDQITEYANTGASSEQVKAKSEQLRKEFETQLAQMGYNRNEVDKYSRSFRDMTTILNLVPKNLTISANASPAIRAFNEFEAKAKSSADRAKKSIGGVGGALRGLGGSGGPVAAANKAIGTLKSPSFNSTSVDKFATALGRFADKLYRIEGGYRAIRNEANKSTMYLPNGLKALSFSTGGVVPGGSGQIRGIDFKPTGTDTVPAMLTPGEYVMTRGAVQALGVPFLDALNRSRSGAPVSSGASRSSGSGRPSVQVVELVPYQEQRIVSAVSQRVTATMSGADMSQASASANRRAELAGVN